MNVRTVDAAEMGRAEAGPVGAARGMYGVHIGAMLALVSLFAAMDRFNMAVLLVPIQKEFGASDTAMGMLAGTAFSIVYAVAALPLARFADVGCRRLLLSLSVAVWSATTALCAVASSFWMLLLVRIGVAAGEAGYGPATHSMIGDIYPRNRRGLAMALMQVGSGLGAGAGAVYAGSIADAYGWRVAFLAMGVPGLLFALLLHFTVREPMRGAFDSAPPGPMPSTMESLVHIFSVPTIRRLVCAKIALNMAAGALLTWLPTFFMRVHHLSASEMSAGYGFGLSVGTPLAALFGGMLTDRLSRHGERWRCYYCSISLLCGVPLALATLLVPSPQIAFVCFFGMMLACGGLTAISSVAALVAVRPDVRGMMTAIIGLCISVIGLGFGPLLVGAMNDSLRSAHGQESVRYTLLAIPVMWSVASLLFYLAGRTTDRDAACVAGK